MGHTRNYSGSVRPGTNDIMLHGNVRNNKDVSCETDSEKRNRGASPNIVQYIPLMGVVTQLKSCTTHSSVNTG